MSNKEFMGQYADVGMTTLRDGWNPLLEDYTNTAFLLASSRLGGRSV